MNQYQHGFKHDILSTIFNLSGKTWLGITGAYAINFFVILIVMIFAFLGFGVTQLVQSLGDFSNIANTAEIFEIYKQIGESLVANKAFIGVAVLTVVILMVVASWFQYFSFLFIDIKIKNKESGFADVFKASLTKGIFKVLGAGILLYLIFIGVIALCSFIGGVTVGGGILLGILAMILMGKFILVLPAFIVGGMTLGESFSFSIEKMTFMRCLKLFGIMLLAGFSIFIVAFVIGLVSAIFTFIPLLGSLIQIAIQIGMSAFFAALITTAMLGMFYRFTDDISENNDEISVDDLLVTD